MASDLKSLRDIIVSSIDNIIATCEETGKEFPKLNEPIQFSEFTPDGIRNHPKVSDNIALAVAAAFQLIQTLQSPPVTLTTSAFRVREFWNMMSRRVFPYLLKLHDIACFAHIPWDCGTRQRCRDTAKGGPTGQSIRLRGYRNDTTLADVPQGLHVKEIAAKNNIDPKKLGELQSLLS